jgi:hypothetical protein
MHDPMRLGQLAHPQRGPRRSRALASLIVKPHRTPKRGRAGEGMPKLVRQMLRIPNERRGALRIPEEPLDDRLLISAAGTRVVPCVQQARA